MQTTIYIRKENEDKWKEIKDKSLFVNIALSELDEPDKDPMPTPPTKKPLPKIPGVSVGFCKHNYAKGMCKFGC